MDISPFAKQLFVASSPLLAGFSVGGAVSYPTVLLHQLKANDSSIHLDFETASWIGSIHGLAGLPSILMPTIMQWRGRKLAFIAACLFSISGWILAYTAKTSTEILISESFHGLGSNSIYAVACLTMTEMMAPRYRDSFIQFYYIALSISMSLTGLIVHYLHWKTISIIMCIPMVLALLLACMWPESPYWLACRGEYDKCEKSFRWLRGTDTSSKKELKELINAQRRYHLDTKTNNNNQSTSSVNNIWKQITSVDFYVPCMHMFVLEYLVQGTGCIIMIIYSIELIQKITKNESIVFLGSFIVNMTLLLGTGCIIAFNKYFYKKTVLLTSILGATISLLSASVISYLQSKGTISEDSYACLFCIVLYLIAISIGIIPIAYPVASALMPVKHRGIGGILYVTNTCVLHTLALKLAPYLFLYLHMWGTFIVFAANGIFCGLIIWKFIPETKGRTLQEIEDFYKYGKFVARTTDHEIHGTGDTPLLIIENEVFQQHS